MLREEIKCDQMDYGSIKSIMQEFGHGNSSVRVRLAGGDPFRFVLMGYDASIMFGDKRVGRIDEGRGKALLNYEEFVPEEAVPSLRLAVSEMGRLSQRIRSLNEDRRRALLLDLEEVMGPADQARKVAQIPFGHKEGLSLAFFHNYLREALPERMEVRGVESTRERYFNVNVHLTGKGGASVPAFYIRSAGDRLETGSLQPGEKARVGMVEEIFLRMSARRNRVVGDDGLAKALSSIPSMGVGPLGHVMENEFSYSARNDDPNKLTFPATAVSLIPIGDTGFSAMTREGNNRMFLGFSFGDEPIAVSRGWLPGFDARPNLWTDLMVSLGHHRPDMLSPSMLSFMQRTDPDSTRDDILKALDTTDVDVDDQVLRVEA